MKVIYGLIYFWLLMLLNSCSQYPSCDNFNCVQQYANDTIYLTGTYIHVVRTVVAKPSLRLLDGVDIPMTMIKWELIPEFIEENNGRDLTIKGVVYLTNGGNLVHFSVVAVEWLEPPFF